MVICVLGRQPELGLAELEALYGEKNVRLIGKNCALVEAPVDFERLGGSLKMAEFIATVPSTQPKNIFKKLSEILPEIASTLPAEGKVTLALSSHGLNISPFKLGGEALKLKRALRALGRSVRVVPSEENALSSAKTYHNRLTNERGVEFLLVATDTETVIGRVSKVQDIDAYRTRDRNRPKRDAFIGMLPPKLAQIIINLAVGPAEPATRSRVSVLDPFCGTGVILQEALLMGYNVYGSDISPKMIEYTKTNLDWLKKSQNLAPKDIKLEIADSTTYAWSLRPPVFVATEAYLGQPLGGQNPSPERLRQIIYDTNGTIKSFLKNISGQLGSGSRLCVAVPAWFVAGKEYRLPVTSELENLGFKQVSFSSTGSLIYRRHDQTTARELLVLQKPWVHGARCFCSCI